jgi:hypothetical protein
MSDQKTGIDNLNIDDLDVEELERRVEMASGGVGADPPQQDGDFCLLYWGSST